MTEQEVTKLIKLNIDNYPGRFLPNASKEQVKAMAATWWQLFKDLPAETVMNAYLRALTVCEFPVTPANIFAELRKMQSANRPSVEELWRLRKSAVTKPIIFSFPQANGTGKDAGSILPRCRIFAVNLLAIMAG